eukprot:COSAG02_NODE_6590_length_3473_cov_2.408000_5_plen_108_part_00
MICRPQLYSRMCQYISGFIGSRYCAHRSVYPHAVACIPPDQLSPEQQGKLSHHIAGRVVVEQIIVVSLVRIAFGQHSLFFKKGLTPKFTWSHPCTAVSKYLCFKSAQ